MGILNCNSSYNLNLSLCLTCIIVDSFERKVFDSGIAVEVELQINRSKMQCLSAAFIQLFNRFSRFE